MPTPSVIEARYRECIDAMTPAERVARSAAMFVWTRDQIARQIISEQGEMDSESLKWKVALRLYESESSVRRLIEREFPDVSR
jgi:hypothetical protein